MIDAVLNRLHHIINTVPAVIAEISDEEMSAKPSFDKWSKKEILGHLIDSATNNHQRFVRAQFESKPKIAYDQNKWNEFNFYQEIDNQQLISFWTIYNQQLIEIIKRISIADLQKEVSIDNSLLSLEFLATDYVEHLEYHLRQIIKY